MNTGTTTGAATLALWRGPVKATEPFDVQWSVALEFKAADLWVGCIYRRTPDGDGGEQRDWWICLLPCIPIHISRRAENALEW